MAEKTFHSITLPGQDTARVPLTAAEFSTSVAYKVKDYCTYQGKLYRCITAHAAGAWNAAHFDETDIAAEFDRKLDIPISKADAPANPRVGDLWIDSDENSPVYNVDVSPTLNSINAVQSGGTKVALNSLDSRKMEHGVITGDFSASVDYRVGDLVFYATTANGITSRTLYRCTTDHNAAAWNAAHFTATTLEVELQKIRDSEADTDMIGDLFGAKSTYAVGDYCVYNDNLYRCIRAIDNSSTSTPAFDPNDWTQVKLANDVSDLNSAISEYEEETEVLINGAYQFNESIYYAGTANNLFTFDIHKTEDYYVNKIQLFVLKSNMENPTYAFKLFSWYISGTQILVRSVSDAISLEAPTENKELRTVVLDEPFKVSAGDGIGIIGTPFKWLGYSTNTLDSASPVLFRDGNYDTISADYRIYSYIPTFVKQQPAVSMYTVGVKMKEFMTKEDYDQIDKKVISALNNDSVVWELGNIGDNGAPIDSNRYLRSKNFVYLEAGSKLWCGQYYLFTVYKYLEDLSFDSKTAQVNEYTIDETGFYKITIYPADTFDSTAYIPSNNVISFTNVQSYSRDICDAINYNNTQNTPIRVSGTDAKMAHDSSIAFDGNDLWVAYYEDDTTYGEDLTNLTTYIVIKKLNPYTREEISSQTFKVGDSIGNYTQSGRAPYIPKLVVYNDYILMYFLGWDGTQLEICSCRINKSTLNLTEFAVCTLQEEDGSIQPMTCSGVSAVYNSYTGISYLPNIIGITAQPQYYNGKWYSTLNSVFGNSPGMKTLLIESLNGIDWTVNRVFDEIGVAQECSFVIKDGYVYAATRAGCYLAKYSIDPEVTGCVKIFQPLAIPLKTAMCIFKGKILLACNIKCEKDSSVSDNRKNMGIFEVDENLNVTLKTRIITEQGMHYPCFAIANDELWFAWSNDYRFLQRFTQRTNVSVSKIEV